MSGNRVIKTKCRSVGTLMDCLKEKFAKLGANWDTFVDPKSGNIAPKGSLISGIGMGYGDKQYAQIRLPANLMGTSRDLGLIQDEKTKTWGFVGDEDDMKYNREIKSKLDAALAAYAEKELRQKIAAAGARIVKVIDTDSKSIPSHIASKLKAGKITFIEAEVDSDSLKSKGVKVRENI